MENSPKRRSGRPGKTHCSANKKYKCNYQNVKSGKCPGYIVSKRRRQTRSEAGRGSNRVRIYEVDWRPGIKQDAPLKEMKSHSAKSPATAPGTAKGFKYTTKSKPTRIRLPRNRNGKIAKAARNKPVNNYCQNYRSSAVRMQTGCVARKSKRRSRFQSRSRLRSRSPSPINWNALRLSPLWQQQDNSLSDMPDFLR